jgi:septal ring factor EnvC (AmiA/AmiB activator)
MVVYIGNLRNSSQIQVVQLQDKCAVLEEKVQSLQMQLQHAEDDLANSERELSAKEDVAALQSMSEENLEDLLKDPQTKIPEVSFCIQYFHFFSVCTFCDRLIIK